MVESITIKHISGELIDDTLTIYTRKFSNGLVITNVEGLGPVEATINITQFASGDGGVFNSSRKENRNIVITCKIMESEKDGIVCFENTRDRLYSLCPTGDKVSLAINFDNRTLKETTGYVESLDIDYWGELEGAQVSIICPNPEFDISAITN